MGTGIESAFYIAIIRKVKWCITMHIFKRLKINHVCWLYFTLKIMFIFKHCVLGKKVHSIIMKYLLASF